MDGESEKVFVRVRKDVRKCEKRLEKVHVWELVCCINVSECQIIMRTF